MCVSWTDHTVTVRLYIVFINKSLARARSMFLSAPVLLLLLSPAALRSAAAAVRSRSSPSLGAATNSNSILFEAPSIAGTTGFPSDFQGFGEQSQRVLGKNGDDGWRGSTDGGRSWRAVVLPAVRGDSPGQHAVVSAGPGMLHNMGNVTAVDDRGADYTSFRSSFVQVFEAEDGGGFSTRPQPRHVRFQGLPNPVTCGNSEHLFGCPFRTDGIGHVRLPDGSLLMSAVVYWAGAHASPNETVRATAMSVAGLPEFGARQKMGSEGSRLAESERGVWF